MYLFKTLYGKLCVLVAFKLSLRLLEWYSRVRVGVRSLSMKYYVQCVCVCNRRSWHVLFVPIGKSGTMFDLACVCVFVVRSITDNDRWNRNAAIWLKVDARRQSNQENTRVKLRAKCLQQTSLTTSKVFSKVLRWRVCIYFIYQKIWNQMSVSVYDLSRLWSQIEIMLIASNPKRIVDLPRDPHGPYTIHTYFGCVLILWNGLQKHRGCN